MYKLKEQTIENDEYIKSPEDLHYLLGLDKDNYKVAAMFAPDSHLMLHAYELKKKHPEIVKFRLYQETYKFSHEWPAHER